jgi:signal transduction histidine kinase
LNRETSIDVPDAESVDFELGECRLLLVEDSPVDAMLLEVRLREDILLHHSIVERAATLDQAQQMLDSSAFDAALVDLGLPDSEGLETLAGVVPHLGPAALVVITGRDDAALAEQAVRRGAQDYLVKGDTRTGDVGRAVAYAIRRQRVLDQLQRARDEQLASKNRFLSHISHELRSPLSVVHQFSSLLLDGIGGPLTSDQQEFLTVLMRNVVQLKGMIEDLLDVSRAQTGRLAVCPRAVVLSDLLYDMATAYQFTAQQRGLSLDFEVPALPPVMADPDRVREVVANLVENAFKFTDAGTITLEATLDVAHVCVTVSDTGSGIRQEDLDRVFEQFFQSGQTDLKGRNGLGLGLFLSRELVERQGGTMRVASRLGHGSTFSFTLPLAQAPTDGTGKGAPLQHPRDGRKPGGDRDPT